MTEPESCGYVFTSRSETLWEYGERLAKNPAGPDPAAVADGGAHRFRVTAGFAEHGERLGATASIEVRQPVAPTPNAPSASSGPPGAWPRRPR